MMAESSEKKLEHMSAEELEKTSEVFFARLDSEGIEYVPVTRNKGESLTIRMTKAHLEALKEIAEPLGIGHTTLARMFILQGLKKEASKRGLLGDDHAASADDFSQDEHLVFHDQSREPA